MYVQAQTFQDPHNTLWKGPHYCNALPKAKLSRPKHRTCEKRMYSY